MANEIKPSTVEKELAEIAKTNLDSFDVKGGEGTSERLVDAIEMIGESTPPASSRRPKPSPPGCAISIAVVRSISW